MNKNKIFNDPVYGFINIPNELVFDIVEHRYFQRLRRIKQLGLTDYVYPGANHTRFHHALGAMHLMGQALTSLQAKGNAISDKEFQAAQVAILLHDIGHGPFSHALEKTLLHETDHEDLSSFLMEKLNEEFGGKLILAIKIFNNTYERPFFHQLVSGQLDIDRLDYLQRDCFFTGVSEGAIGADRIIKMLEVYNDELVVEEKGIYSIENFLNARRLMYWQVYLHKAAISAERMLISVVKRAQYLIREKKVSLKCSTPLEKYLKAPIGIKDLKKSSQLTDAFIDLDDHDIWNAIKEWQYADDRVLSILSKHLINRKVFKVTLSNEKIEKSIKLSTRKKVAQQYNLTDEEVKFLVMKGDISNAAYFSKGKTINILTKKGEILDVAQASELPNIKAISKIVRKYYLCWPKDVSL